MGNSPNPQIKEIITKFSKMKIKKFEKMQLKENHISSIIGMGEETVETEISVNGNTGTDMYKDSNGNGKRDKGEPYVVNWQQ